MDPRFRFTPTHNTRRKSGNTLHALSSKPSRLKLIWPVIIDRVLRADEARAKFLIYDLKEALAQRDLKRDKTEDLTCRITVSGFFTLKYKLKKYLAKKKKFNFGFIIKRISPASRVEVILRDPRFRFTFPHPLKERRQYSS